MKFKYVSVLGLACLSLGLAGTFTYQATTQNIQANTVSTKNFKEIKLGMNKRQVVDILGEPAHNKYEDSVWTYQIKDKQTLTLIFDKETLENDNDHTLISTKDSVAKKVSPKTLKKNINSDFAKYFKQAYEYAKVGQTEFAWSTMIAKVTFNGDDEVKVTAVNGFNNTPAKEKNEIAKKIAKLSQSFLHRYNKKDFDLEFYENKHEVGSNKNDSLTKFEWKNNK